MKTPKALTVKYQVLPVTRLALDIVVEIEADGRKFQETLVIPHRLNVVESRSLKERIVDRLQSKLKGRVTVDRGVAMIEYTG